MPDTAMMAGPENLARFIETADELRLGGVFSDSGVTILENFPPHLFKGARGLRQWRTLMRRHLEGVEHLHHSFGPPQDFSQTGDLVFFSVPTVWTGIDHGKPFTEHGGWSFLLVRQGRDWRVQAYAWSVVMVSMGVVSPKE